MSSTQAGPRSLAAFSLRARAWFEKARLVIEKLRAMKLRDAAELIEAGVEETLSYYAFPSEHWRSLRTNNPLERLNREIRRRTRAW